MQDITCPLDYSLCSQTVTLYRRQGEAVLRQTVSGCYFAFRDIRSVDDMGCRSSRPFLLILPGAAAEVLPGDRVLEGTGPQVTAESWREFIPAKVPGLAEVAYVTPCRWGDAVCHLEAGRK